jgi:hypothetical protein
MASQWENFLQNLGEWHGSFASLDASGTIVDSTPSILSLEQEDGQPLVHFQLRRFGNGLDSAPTREISQEYRSLGKQVVFFASGSFCKGSLQVAPGTVFGAEFGFVAGDRRHRLVQLYSPEGAVESLVMIREFRAGSNAIERPPLEADHLLGHWTGQAATISAKRPERGSSWLVALPLKARAAHTPPRSLWRLDLRQLDRRCLGRAGLNGRRTRQPVGAWLQARLGAARSRSLP